MWVCIPCTYLDSWSQLFGDTRNSFIHVWVFVIQRLTLRYVCAYPDADLTMFFIILVIVVIDDMRVFFKVCMGILGIHLDEWYYFVDSLLFIISVIYYWLMFMFLVDMRTSIDIFLIFEVKPSLSFCSSLALDVFDHWQILETCLKLMDLVMRLDLAPGEHIELHNWCF